MPRTWPKKFAILSADAAFVTCSWPTTSPRSRCLSNGCGTKKKRRSSVQKRISSPLQLLTARVSKARLGSALSPCADPPNPKRHSHRRMPRTRLPGQARVLQFQPTQRARLAAGPMEAAGWKKRNWTPHCSCWWSGRNTSPARPGPPSLCPRVRRWFAAPGLALTRRAPGIASIVVLPLLPRSGEVRGLFELFSDHPYAFEERDLIALERMADLTLTALDLAEQRQNFVPAPAPRREPERPVEAPAATATIAPPASAIPFGISAQAPLQDPVSVPLKPELVEPELVEI